MARLQPYIPDGHLSPGTRSVADGKTDESLHEQDANNIDPLAFEHGDPTKALLIDLGRGQ
jgi:hypothetical protein